MPAINSIVYNSFRLLYPFRKGFEGFLFIDNIQSFKTFVFAYPFFPRWQYRQLWLNIGCESGGRCSYID